LLWLKSRPALIEESARKELLDTLAQVVSPLSTTNLSGFPSFKVELLAEPVVAQQVEKWLSTALEKMR
jgi:hypothetical protein